MTDRLVLPKPTERWVVSVVLNVQQCQNNKVQQSSEYAYCPVPTVKYSFSPHMDDRTSELLVKLFDLSMTHYISDLEWARQMCMFGTDWIQITMELKLSPDGQTNIDGDFMESMNKILDHSIQTVESNNF